MNETSQVRSRSRQFMADLIFFAPGLAISAVVSAVIFSLLVSAITLIPILLIGVLLVPLLLLFSGASADLSRMRYNSWLKNNRYLQRGRLKLPKENLELVLIGGNQFGSFSNLKTYWGVLTSHRLWLDTLFEGFIVANWRVIIGTFYLVYLFMGLTFAIMPPLAGIFGIGGGGPMNLVNLTHYYGFEVLKQFTDSQLVLIETVTWFVAGSLMLLSLIPLTSWLARREAELTYGCLNNKPAGASLRAWGAGALITVSPLLVGLLLVVPASNVAAGGVWILIGMILILALLFTPRYPKFGATLSLLWGMVVLGGVLWLLNESSKYSGGSLERFNDYSSFNYEFAYLCVVATGIYCLQIMVLAAMKNKKTAIAISALLALIAAASVVSSFMIGFKPFEPVTTSILLACFTIALIIAPIAGLAFRWLVDMSRQTYSERTARAAAEAREAIEHTARQQAETISAKSEAQSAELIERARIAREMHDVVAHSMSVISVQAKSAPYRLATSNLDQATKDEFNSIAATSKEALQEMRALLGVLRGSTGESGAETAPQPTLQDIPNLVDQSRNSGATISLAGFGEFEAQVVPATVGLALYRAAQEGISNALRHAPGSAIEIKLQQNCDQLQLEVTNGAPSQEALALKTVGSTRPGHGLRGINERVNALGGRMQNTLNADGSHTLTVTLPLPTSSR